MTDFIRPILTFVLNVFVLPLGLFFLALPSDSVAQQNRTVHLITIADMHGSNRIGSEVGVQKFYTAMWSGLGRNNPKDYSLQEKDLYPKKILELIGNMRVGRNDTVVFYYTGHGAFDKNRGLFYTIAEPNNSEKLNLLLKNDVLATIQKHSPRLIVIVSDCCSVYSGYQPQEDGMVGGANPDPTRPLFRKLFFESSGVVDFTGAQEGNTSWVNNGPDGPWMTNVMCELLYSNRNQNIGWKNFFPMIQKGTAEYSSKKRAANPTNDGSGWEWEGKLQIPQVPRAFSLGN